MGLCVAKQIGGQTRQTDCVVFQGDREMSNAKEVVIDVSEMSEEFYEVVDKMFREELAKQGKSPEVMFELWTLKASYVELSELGEK